MMIVKVHAKVRELLKEFYIINPQNIMFNEGEVEGGSELTDLTGIRLTKAKMIIHFPTGGKLVVEETKEELLKLFNGDGNDISMSKV